MISRGERSGSGEPVNGDDSVNGGASVPQMNDEAAAAAAAAAACAASLQRPHREDHLEEGGATASDANGLWWTGGGSPRLPTPPDGEGMRTSASRQGSGSGGDKYQFWRSEYHPQEFASVRRPSERVTLNLSGTLFMTTRDTLARNPHTYFAAMLRMQPPTTPGSACDSGSTSLASSGRAGGGGGGGEDESSQAASSSNGVEFFIDRDPTHFRFILNYLRDSYIGLDSFGEEDLHFLEELSHEAQFFNIAGLCADISRRMSEIARKQREGPSGDKDFRLVQCTTAQIQDIFHEWVIEKNYEFECMQIVSDTAYIVLGRRVSRGELALVERLMKT